MFLLSWALYGSLLASLEFVPALTQFRHTRRTRSLAGVSAYTQLAWTASWLVWLLYSVQKGLYPMTALCVLALAPSVLMSTYLLRSGTVGVSVVRLTASVGGLLLFVTAMHPTLGVTLLVVYDLTMTIPQVVRACREKDLSGLSVRSYLVSLVTDAAWIVYALGVADPLAGSSSAISLLAAAVIVARVCYLRVFLRGELSLSGDPLVSASPSFSLSRVEHPGVHEGGVRPQYSGSPASLARFQE